MKCYLYKRSSLVHKTCSDETGSTLPSLWTDSCVWVTVWKWKIFIKFTHKNEPSLWAAQKKKEKMTKYYFIRLVSEIISEKINFSRDKKHKFCHLGAGNSNSSSIPDCFLFFVLPTSSREQSLTWKSWKCRSMLQDIKCYHFGVS